MRLAAAISLMLLSTPVCAAQCDELYVQRNGIYKAQGYCFHTQRAIETFGNAGCQFDDVTEVPLSVRQRRIVEEIKSEERSLGCQQ